MVTEGMRVGKYELGRTLGEGNSAKVKLAKDIVSGQSFAVKIIDKSRTSRLNVPFQVFLHFESIFLVFLALYLNGLKVDSGSYTLLIFDNFRLRERYAHSKS